MSHNIKSFLYPLFKSLKILQNLIFTLQRNSLPITTRRQDLLHHPSCSFLKQTCMVTRQMKTVAIRLSNPLRTYEKKTPFCLLCCVRRKENAYYLCRLSLDVKRFHQVHRHLWIKSLTKMLSFSTILLCSTLQLAYNTARKNISLSLNISAEKYYFPEIERSLQDFDYYLFYK